MPCTTNTDCTATGLCSQADPSSSASPYVCNWCDSTAAVGTTQNCYSGATSANNFSSATCNSSTNMCSFIYPTACSTNQDCTNSWEECDTAVLACTGKACSTYSDCDTNNCQSGQCFACSPTATANAGGTNYEFCGGTTNTGDNILFSQCDTSGVYPTCSMTTQAACATDTDCPSDWTSC